MILFFDSSDFDSTRLTLIGAKVIEHNFATKNLSEQLLSETKKFLAKHKIRFKQINTLAVVTGPGGFSRIRTVVATVNALAFGLNIPVIGLPKDKLPTDLRKLKTWPGKKLVMPKYDRQPTITISRKS